jgi:hypothetical protein
VPDRLPIRTLLALMLSWLGACAALHGQTSDVSVKVSVVRTGASGAKHPDSSGAVVWLTPSQSSSGILPPKPGHYRLTQRDKQFTPHLLVIPTGSTVDFPNLDPFFHNVFSFFDGKRFDLGLYESGTSRAVHFNRDGVSYIFCNIHPEMSAVIITVSTPYYGVSQADGVVKLSAVPAGTFELHLWIEGATPEDLRTADRKVKVGPADRDLGSIEIKVDAHPGPHKNKFGEDYREPDAPPY